MSPALAAACINKSEPRPAEKNPGQHGLTLSLGGAFYGDHHTRSEPYSSSNAYTSSLTQYHEALESNKTAHHHASLRSFLRA